jgi:hypothetical protein
VPRRGPVAHQALIHDDGEVRVVDAVGVFVHQNKQLCGLGNLRTAVEDTAVR